MGCWFKRCFICYLENNCEGLGKQNHRVIGWEGVCPARKVPNTALSHSHASGAGGNRELSEEFSKPNSTHGMESQMRRASLAALLTQHGCIMELWPIQPLLGCVTPLLKASLCRQWLADVFSPERAAAEA